MEIATKNIEGLSKRKIKAIANKPDKSAEAINLVYVHDNEPGIQRIKKGETFEYFSGSKKIVDEKTLSRIKSLVIPPAWEKVWICSLSNGHLQATGFDIKNRKQYKYHPQWNSLRNHTKYYRLLQFGKLIPDIRTQLKKDLSLPGLPVEKVLALIVSLMELTNIRIGNNFYEKLYGSFGLTTLKDRHVSISGNKLKFMFKGKKGVEHDINITSKKLSSLVKKCRDIPGKELFQYYDEQGVRKPIDSGMVNEYIKKISSADFSAKDFRTWSGTVYAFLTFKELEICETITERRKKIVEVLDVVAKHLGNTRTVCKKYYVHPSIISLYEEGALEKYFDHSVLQKSIDNAALTVEEQAVLKILETS